MKASKLKTGKYSFFKYFFVPLAAVIWVSLNIGKFWYKKTEMPKQNKDALLQIYMTDYSSANSDSAIIKYIPKELLRKKADKNKSPASQTRDELQLMIKAQNAVSDEALLPGKITEDIKPTEEEAQLFVDQCRGFGENIKTLPEGSMYSYKQHVMNITAFPVDFTKLVLFLRRACVSIPMVKSKALMYKTAADIYRWLQALGVQHGQNKTFGGSVCAASSVQTLRAFFLKKLSNSMPEPDDAESVKEAQRLIKYIDDEVSVYDMLTEHEINIKLCFDYIDYYSYCESQKKRFAVKFKAAVCGAYPAYVDSLSAELHKANYERAEKFLGSKCALSWDELNKLVPGFRGRSSGGRLLMKKIMQYFWLPLGINAQAEEEVEAIINRSASDRGIFENTASFKKIKETLENKISKESEAK